MKLHLTPIRLNGSWEVVRLPDTRIAASRRNRCSAKTEPDDATTPPHNDPPKKPAGLLRRIWELVKRWFS